MNNNVQILSINNNMGNKMKKSFILLIITIMSIIITAEPYRPYPQIYVHGYNTSSVKSSNFGITMKKSVDKGDIEHCIANQPYNPSQAGEIYNPLDQTYYVSKFVGDSLEEGKLAYQCFVEDSQIINYWRENLMESEYNYWLNGNVLNEVNEYLTHVSPPKNIFLETIEFDYPGIGSADEGHPNSITPTSYQVGRGRELLCKFKEVLINYYTDGEPYYVYSGDLLTNVKLKKPNGDIVNLQKEHLDSDLHNSDPKVIFVAHSYGGVVLRQMLMELDERTQSLPIQNIMECQFI